MKIQFLTSGRRCPSTRYRILQYLPYFQAAGHRTRVAHSFPEKYRDLRVLTSYGNCLLRRLARYRDYASLSWDRPDLIYLEREILNYPAFDVERLFLKSGVPVVLDIDDGIFLHFPDKLEYLLKHSTLVVAGSELLAEYCRERNSNVVVIPTSLELKNYPLAEARSAPNPVRIGWTGTAYNLSNFQLLSESLQAVSQHWPLELHLIAENLRPLSRIDLGDIPVVFHRWSEQTEISDLLRFDIGLMPLEETPWNRYKCGFKILQYMAVGVPAIASPVGANSQIIEHQKNGLLASTTDEWTAALTSLIESSELRSQLGQAGRNTVEQRYSVERNYLLLERALEEFCFSF